MITYEEDGLLYTPGDVNALAESLRRLAADQALRARFGDTARRLAPDFTAERPAPAVLAVYGRVADGALG